MVHAKLFVQSRVLVSRFRLAINYVLVLFISYQLASFILDSLAHWQAPEVVQCTGYQRNSQ